MLCLQGLQHRNPMCHDQPLRSLLGLLCNSRMLLGSHVGCGALLQLRCTRNRYAQGWQLPLLLHQLCKLLRSLGLLLCAAYSGCLLLSSCSGPLSLLLRCLQLGSSGHPRLLLRCLPSGCSGQLRMLLLQELVDDAAQRCRMHSLLLDVAQPCRHQQKRRAVVWLEGSLWNSEYPPASLPPLNTQQPQLTRLDVLLGDFSKLVIVCCERQLQVSAEERGDRRLVSDGTSTAAAAAAAAAAATASARRGTKAGL